MAENLQNIFPNSDQLVHREAKEKMLSQKGIAIWMTGLSGSGKSTIAILAEKMLYHQGVLTQVLDGDNVRAGINNNLDFSEAGRKENIRRIAEINKLFVQCGVVTINCFVSPVEELRQMACAIIGKDDFVEVFIDTPLEICESRDVKGLYKKARAGEIKDFTGISAPFERPANPDIVIETSNRSVESCANQLVEIVLNRIKL